MPQTNMAFDWYSSIITINQTTNLLEIVKHEKEGGNVKIVEKKRFPSFDLLYAFRKEETARLNSISINLFLKNKPQIFKELYWIASGTTRCFTCTSLLTIAGHELITFNNTELRGFKRITCYRAERILLLMERWGIFCQSVDGLFMIVSFLEE